MTKTIMVVDDDRFITEVITMALEDNGYVVVAAEGIDAVAIAQRSRPDVVLLDICMPVIDGPQVRRGLYEHPETANIPVIAISAANNLRARASEMQADDYLAKPFEIAELLLRVDKWAT